MVRANESALQRKIEALEAEVARAKLYHETHKALRWYLGARGVNTEEAAMASAKALEEFELAEAAAKLG